MAAVSTGVATMSSLAHLQVQDTEEQRQHRHETNEKDRTVSGAVGTE